MKLKGKVARIRCLAGIILVTIPVATRGFLVSSPIHRNACFLRQALEESPEPPARRGWRRALRKAFKPKRTRQDSVFILSQKESPSKGVTAMQMVVSLEDELVTNKILADFEKLSPIDVFPNLSLDEFGVARLPTNQGLIRNEVTNGTIMQSIEYEDELLVRLDAIRSEMQANPGQQPNLEASIHRSTVINAAVKNVFENFLLGLFERWSVEPAHHLQAVVVPKGNVLSRILRGKFKGDAEITFEKLHLKPIQISSGTIQAKRMLLNLWSFTPDLLRKGVVRYPSQFDFHCSDCVFSEGDLMRSPCIRNGLEQLLLRVLKRAGVSPTHVNVKSIRLLPSGKIACSGEAATAFSGIIPFQVRSWIEITSRGHVLTFSGLEVALQPALGLFVPVLPEIDLDIGHNARLTSLKMDGKKKTLTLSAKVTVTPDHTLKLRKYQQTKESYAAHFTFDVGLWITKIGKFSQ